MRSVLIAVLVPLFVAPASAQDVSEDWQLTVRGDTQAASVAYDSGISVVVRCQAGGLETYIEGLTPDRPRDDARRTIDYAVGSGPLRASTWQVNEDGSVIFADLPGPLARRFRSGGDLQLRTQARGDQPPRRYVVTLPPSATSINQVLVACGKPTVEPRDALRADETSEAPTASEPSPIRWARHPQPRYPGLALQRGVSGMAVISCVARDDGALDQCEIEVERPARAGFGAASLRATRDARLNAVGAQDSAQPRGLVTFTMRFWLP
jgi:TonB family protein